MFRSDGFQGPFRIALFGEFRNLVEGKAVAVGGSAALARPDQAIVISKDRTGAPVSSDVGGDRIARMKMPVPGNRGRIKQQERAGARTRVGAGSGEPPQSLMLKDRSVDKLAFQ